MKKSSVVIIVLVTIFSIFVGYNCFLDSSDHINKDAQKFKDEYENLNNKTNEKNNKKFQEVEISKSNVIKYSSYDEVEEVLKNGTGVIYIGTPECPSCRNIVPVLLRSSEEVELDTIYYLNVENDRDLLILDNNKKIITEKKGSKQYYNLVKSLDSILDEYILTSIDGDEVKTGNKRINDPLVIFVKDGKIIYFYKDTNKDIDPYKPFSDRQSEELLLEYIKYMGVVSGSICDETC